MFLPFYRHFSAVFIPDAVLKLIGESKIDLSKVSTGQNSLPGTT